MKLSEVQTDDEAALLLWAMIEAGHSLEIVQIAQTLRDASDLADLDVSLPSASMCRREPCSPS